MRYLIRLKVDGANLTGNIIDLSGKVQKTMQNGKTVDNQVSFTVYLDVADILDYKGKVGTDQISFKVRRRGDSSSRDFVVKKVSQLRPVC